MPQPSKYQSAVIDWFKTGNGNALIEARAGSGKTSLLVMLAAEIDTDKRAVFLAFNKSIATELSNRLPDHVDAATFHSVCLRAYSQTRKRRPKVEGGKLQRLYDALYGSDPDNIRGAVLKLVGLAKASAMVPESSADDWAEIIAHHDVEFDTQTDEENGTQRAREMLAASNAELDIIDFDDMLYLCWLKNAPIHPYDYVMIDEAQDTNTVQRILLSRMLGRDGRLVAVGDSYQAIYGFRGADSGAMDAIKEEFNCRRLPLSISYRCPRAVIDAANAALGLGEVVIEPREDAPEGSVTYSPRMSYGEFSADDMIVCRNTAPVVALAYRLIGARVPCKVLGRDIGRGLVILIKKMRADGIDRLIDKLEEYEQREIEAAMKKRGAEMRMQAITDRVDSIRVSIDALDENHRTVPELIRRIEELFSDNGPRACTLSTVHKAKGMEAQRVFVLDSKLMPSKYARQDWQREQERNLIYVAYTRALESLVFIDSAELREIALSGGVR